MARLPIEGELESCPWGISPLPGREYRVAYACCSGCQAALAAGKSLLEGHFACSGQADDMIADGWAEEARLLDGDWLAVLSREPP